MVEEHWIEDLEEFEASSQDSQASSHKDARPGRFNKGKLPYVLLGIGAVLLLFIVLVGFFGGDDQSDDQARLQRMAASLTDLEKRLEAVQARQEKLLERMSDLEPEYKFDTLFQNMNTLSNEMDAFEKELRSEFADLEQKLARSPETQDVPGSGAPAEKSSSGSPGQTERTHVVQKGENLFRIGLQYGVEPEKIREWNDLDPDEPIYPGQELIVGSGKASD